MKKQILEELFSLDDCDELRRLHPFDSNWEDAIEYTKQFRETHGNTQVIAGKQVIGYHLSKDDWERLQNQNGGALNGIRIYLGLDSEGVFRIVIVATESDGKDDYNVPINYPTNETLPLLGEARPCPEWCSKSNVLNTP